MNPKTPTPRTAADVEALAEDILIIGTGLTSAKAREAIEVAAYTLWDYAEQLAREEQAALGGL